MAITRAGEVTPYYIKSLGSYNMASNKEIISNYKYYIMRVKYYMYLYLVFNMCIILKNYSIDLKENILKIIFRDIRKYLRVGMYIVCTAFENIQKRAI